MSIGAGALVAYPGLNNFLRPAARLILFSRSFVELQGAAFLLRDSVLAFRADDACAIRRNHEKPPAKVAYLLVAASSGIIRIHPVKAGRFGADQHLYLVDVIVIRRHLKTAVWTGGGCISHIVPLYRLSALFALYFKRNHIKGVAAGNLPRMSSAL
jgi:hypothetical protein